MKGEHEPKVITVPTNIDRKNVQASRFLQINRKNLQSSRFLYIVTEHKCTIVIITEQNCTIVTVLIAPLKCTYHDTIIIHNTYTNEM